jgi:hypothetical protein
VGKHEDHADEHELKEKCSVVGPERTIILVRFVGVLIFEWMEVSDFDLCGPARG